MNKISKFISLVLRHHPEALGLTLDEHGWADVEEMIHAIQQKQPFTFHDLEQIVKEDTKQRYSFNEDITLIRANQGHSIPVDVQLQQIQPPDVLWHGTAERFISSIDKIGLNPKSRLYVHLSTDIETANQVGKRHGKPFIYQIDARQMHQDGYKFYLSKNQVWLTKKVPAKYLIKQRSNTNEN